MGPQPEGGPSFDMAARPGGEGRNYGGQQQPEDNRRYQDRDVPQDQLLPRPNGGFASENRTAGSPSGSASGRERDWAPDQHKQSDERSRSRTRNGRNASGQNSRQCNKCGENLTGQFVRALGGTFHLDCFRCQVCKVLFCYA